jgi:hypothetical protein
MAQPAEAIGAPVLMKLLKETQERQDQFVGFEIIVGETIFDWEIRFRPDEMSHAVLVNAGFLADFEKFKVQSKRGYLEGRLYFPQDYRTFNKSEPLYLERTAQFKIFVL